MIKQPGQQSTRPRTLIFPDAKPAFYQARELCEHLSAFLVSQHPRQSWAIRAWRGRLTGPTRIEPLEGQESSEGPPPLCLRVLAALLGLAQEPWSTLRQARAGAWWLLHCPGSQRGCDGHLPPHSWSIVFPGPNFSFGKRNKNKTQH